MAFAGDDCARKSRVGFAAHFIQFAVGAYRVVVEQHQLFCPCEFDQPCPLNPGSCLLYTSDAADE